MIRHANTLWGRCASLCLSLFLFVLFPITSNAALPPICSPPMQTAAGHYKGNSFGHISQIAINPSNLILTTGQFDGFETQNGIKRTNQNVMFQNPDFSVKASALRTLFYTQNSTQDIKHVVAHPDGSFFYLESGSDADHYVAYRLDSSGNQISIGALKNKAPREHQAGFLMVSKDGQSLYFAYQITASQVHIIKYDFASKSIDTNFDFTISYNPKDDKYVSTLEELKDGSLLVALFGKRSQLLKINAATGALDDTFSASFAVGYGALDIAQQSDGKLIVGGAFSITKDGKDYDNLIRLLPNGSVDSSFAPQRSIATSTSIVDNFRGSSVVKQVLVDTSDSIFIQAPLTKLWNDREYGKVIKFNADGSPSSDWQKNTFSNFTQADGSYDRQVPTAINLQSDGKLVIAYDHHGYSNLAQRSLVRVHNNGILDTTINQSQISSCTPPMSKHTNAAIDAGLCDVGDQNYLYASSRDSLLFRYNLNEMPALQQAGYQREFIHHYAHELPHLGQVVDSMVSYKTGNLFVLHENFGVVAYSPAGSELWRKRIVPLNNLTPGSHQRWVHELALDQDETALLVDTSRSPKTGWFQRRVMRLDAQTGNFYEGDWDNISIYSTSSVRHFGLSYSPNQSYIFFTNTDTEKAQGKPTLERVDAVNGDNRITLELPNISYRAANAGEAGIAFINDTTFILASISASDSYQLHRMRLVDGSGSPDPEGEYVQLDQSYGSNGVVTLGVALRFSAPHTITANAQGEAFIQQGRTTVKVDASGHINASFIPVTMFDGHLSLQAINRNYCPTVVNMCVDPSAAECDLDKDGLRNAVDLDDDQDGIPDTVEGNTDIDNDGLANAIDLDSDGDGIPDLIEAQASAIFKSPLGQDNDNNGIDDAFKSGLSPVNTDGIDQADYLDTDTDNDGSPDTQEAKLSLLGQDADKDGLDDAIDNNAQKFGDAHAGITNPLTHYATQSDEVLWRAITVAPNKPPTWLLTSVEVAENTIFVVDMNATDDSSSEVQKTLSYALTGSIDDALFVIDTKTGLLSFKTAADYESPNDQGTDNTYNITIQVCDEQAACHEQGLSIRVQNADEDRDNDGLLDSEETTVGTLPTQADSDHDGLLDGAEVKQYKTNPLKADSDEDGVKDKAEIELKTNPLLQDSDGDGLYDGFEIGTNPTQAPDQDGDGLINARDSDDDGDGLFTQFESADLNQDGNPVDALDIDKDGLANYLDNDDDGDGKLTADEQADPNGDHNPIDAMDQDGDQIPSYLDAEESQKRKLQVKAWLQGAYDAKTGLMHDQLRERGLIPLEPPYAAMRGKHNANEKINEQALTVIGEKAIVDWVLVELRDFINVHKVIASRAALIRRDGFVVSADTLEPVLEFDKSLVDAYFISLRHRNHLGVITIDAIKLSNKATLIDVTAPDARFIRYSRFIDEKSEQAFLWAGDMNQDHTLIGLGRGNDSISLVSYIVTHPNNPMSNQSFVVEKYSDFDTNMDGWVIAAGGNNDLNLLLANIRSYPENTTTSANYIMTGAFHSLRDSVAGLTID